MEPYKFKKILGRFAKKNIEGRDIINWKKIKSIMKEEKFIIDGRYILKDVTNEKITYL